MKGRLALKYQISVDYLRQEESWEECYLGEIRHFPEPVGVLVRDPKLSKLNSL